MLYQHTYHIYLICKQWSIICQIHIKTGAITIERVRAIRSWSLVVQKIYKIIFSLLKPTRRKTRLWPTTYYGVIYVGFINQYIYINFLYLLYITGVLFTFDGTIGKRNEERGSRSPTWPGPGYVWRLICQKYNALWASFFFCKVDIFWYRRNWCFNRFFI